jgi:hypothetical protein
MEIEKIEKYLKVYLDDIILPNVNRLQKILTDDSLVEPITMNVTDVLKGSYQPPIYHVFIQIEPHDTLKSLLKKTETDIDDFFKVFSINNRINIHWNKSPAFKNTDFHGTQDL